MKKLTVAVVPVLAALGLAAAPVAANAGEGLWEHHGVPITAGQPVPITLRGHLSIVYDDDYGRYTCLVHATGTLENPEGYAPGIDEVTSATFSNCREEYFDPEGDRRATDIRVRAADLPWTGELEDGVYDKLKLAVNAAYVNTHHEEVEPFDLSGTLMPLVDSHGLLFEYEYWNEFEQHEYGQDVYAVGELHLEGPSGMKQIVADFGDY